MSRTKRTVRTITCACLATLLLSGAAFAKGERIAGARIKTAIRAQLLAQGVYPVIESGPHGGQISDYINHSPRGMQIRSWRIREPFGNPTARTIVFRQGQLSGRIEGTAVATGTGRETVVSDVRVSETPFWRTAVYQQLKGTKP